MMNLMKYPVRVALTLALPLATWAQTPPPEAALPSAPPAAPASAPASEGCRPLTDKATAADMKALTAQAQKLGLDEQARLYANAMSLWTQAVAQCEGRAKDRAQRNLADNQKTSDAISEQMGSGPECAAAHKDASAVQDIARQALSDRRWTQASVLFRKAENMWELAADRCVGTQQELANRRREQSEIDGENAEHCAPLFEKARESTQKLRATSAGLSREDKHDASQLTETLWRDAVGQCKGASVQDIARNNAQALARERGTPWVARVAPAPTAAASVLKQASGTGAAGGATTNLGSAFNALGNTATPAIAPQSATQEVKPPVKPGASAPQPAEFMAGTTRFNGQFLRDPDGTTFSGTGKMSWVHGDVFDGTLVKSQRHGKGRMVWANGQSYDGDWVNDTPTGRANARFANGNQYEGAVTDGQPHGQGRMHYASGDTYTGQFKTGEPEGTGTYIWKNGQQFEGAWKNGRPNGQGKLKFATGNLFEGTVVDGVPHGTGRLVFATGDIYEGQCVDGQPEGQGTFTWTNGDQYVGLWKAGKKHGFGTFTWKSGELWDGMFVNDAQGERAK